MGIVNSCVKLPEGIQNNLKEVVGFSARTINATSTELLSCVVSIYAIFIFMNALAFAVHEVSDRLHLRLASSVID